MSNYKGNNIIVGYGRKSREDKDKKAISPENQRAQCEMYAKARGCRFVYFEDVNRTGDNLNRTGFKEMVAFIKANNVKCIVVWQLDRLTRNLEDYFGTIQPTLRECDTTIASINQHFDNIFDLDPIILAVYMGVSAQELKTTKDRNSSTTEYRAKNGYLLGKAPVGYLNVRDENKRGIVVPDPDKKEHIKRCYELYATGLFSYYRVSQEVAKYGFVDSKGKPYTIKRIEDILKSPVYIGKVVHKDEIYDGKHEAIISDELFYRVQLLLEGSENKSPKGNVYLYSNFIKCAKCGYSMIGHLRHGAHNSGDYIYYRCSNYSKIHKKEKNIRQEIIDEAIQEVIESFDITDKEIKVIKKEIYNAIDDLKKYEHKSIDDLRKQYDEVVDDITLYLTNKVEGISDITKGEVLKKLEAKKEAIAHKIANLAENSKDTTKRISILIDFANRIPELYLKATLEEKRLILNTIAESIIYDEERNTLRVKLRPVFEHLRQIKLKKKQEFSASLETLSGTLETRSESAIQTLKNDVSTLSKIRVIGTRTNRLNTEIEPSSEDSKKFNVDGGT